jgi:O-acetyl-ADP-ribose deacetylase (regulator of RNase III)
MYMMTIQEEWRSEQVGSTREARDERMSRNVESEIGTVGIPSFSTGCASVPKAFVKGLPYGM